jgi:chromosome segregation ATPase
VSLEGTNKNLVVADNKINKLSASLQALQAQQTTTNNAIVELKADLAHAGEFNKLADEKFNKLIALTSELAVHSTDMENSVVGQLKEAAQKEGANIAKVDLANEKLSRLIEILKAIAKEQANIGPLASTLGTMQKDQASIMKNQKEIREVLGDLRRKANVNISRNDDIKKSLEKTNPAKGGAGGK